MGGYENCDLRSKYLGGDLFLELGLYLVFVLFVQLYLEFTISVVHQFQSYYYCSTLIRDKVVSELLRDGTSDGGSKGGVNGGANV